MPVTVHLTCSLNVKREQKVGPALARLCARAGWEGAVWEKPLWDAELRHFRVEGWVGLDAERPADVVFELLTQIEAVTNHCRIGGPRFDADGRLNFNVYADGRDNEVQSVVSLSAGIWEPVPPKASDARES